jgi:glycerol-3-phosphate dehydrogenase
MERNPKAAAQDTFDVLIIGGGAFGAAAAWDASLRGLRTILVEAADFGGGASAECFKMVHGGIRYLQHADVKRLRHSARERSALLRIAPHLVQPLPIAIPTYGHGREGKIFLGTGARVYDYLTFDRNAGIGDPERRIASTRFLDADHVLEHFPTLTRKQLTGAVVFEDGQMYNPARLVLAFVRSAVRAGAVTLNYTEATEFLWSGSRVCGVRARDRITGEQYEIRARLVLNAAGPGAEYLLQPAARFGQWHRGTFSRDAYFIVRRRPTTNFALAVQGQSRDRDAMLSRAARHLFVVPWRQYTLVGVWHRVFEGRPETASVSEEELDSWLQELGASYPALELRREEIVSAHCGLVPFGDAGSTSKSMSFGKESRFIDHRKLHGVEGLVTLIGIRFTTARADAGQALDLLLTQMDKPPRRPDTETIPLLGGDIPDFAALRARAQLARPAGVSSRSLDALLRNHGTEYQRVLALTRDDASERECVGGDETLMCEVTHAVRHEMALTLEDVVLRRTNLGSGSHPGREALERVSLRMQNLLGWSERHRQEELNRTENTLRRQHAVADLDSGMGVRAQYAT